MTALCRAASLLALDSRLARRYNGHPAATLASGLSGDPKLLQNSRTVAPPYTTPTEAKLQICYSDSYSSSNNNSSRCSIRLRRDNSHHHLCSSNNQCKCSYSRCSIRLQCDNSHRHLCSSNHQCKCSYSRHNHCRQFSSSRAWCRGPPHSMRCSPLRLYPSRGPMHLQQDYRRLSTPPVATAEGPKTLGGLGAPCRDRVRWHDTTCWLSSVGLSSPQLICKYSS